MLTHAVHEDAVGAKEMPCKAMPGDGETTRDDDVEPATYRHTEFGASPDVVTYIVKNPPTSARAAMPRQPSVPDAVVLPRRNDAP